MKPKITTLLVDDEKKSLAILESKITRFCPELEIIRIVQSPEKALILIKDLKPQLVFLDVKMPVLSGFEMLSHFEEAPFEVIFATAFDQYAIDAINHFAIGYLTKPINNDALQLTVQNAIKNISEKTANKKNEAFVKNFLSSSSSQKLAIPSLDGFDFVSTEEIIRCEGFNGYTKFHFKDRLSILSSYSLGYFKKKLARQNFFQPHKSHIINMTYVSKYFNEGNIQLTNNDVVPLARARKSDFLACFALYGSVL